MHRYVIRGDNQNYHERIIQQMTFVFFFLSPIMQMADSDKPPDIVEKIVQGKIRKFYEAVCLTQQPHMVMEGNPMVTKVLDDLGIVVKQFEAQSI